MNKKLLAVAVAAALAAPLAANADSGNVKIYGSMHVSIDSLDGKNAAGTDLDRNWNAASNSSYIGFTGAEDLGNGLKAVWQLEQQVNLGSTATGGGNNVWTSRNSFAGLAGGFGTAVIGTHDTPVKILGRKVDMFGDQIGDSRNLIAVDGAGMDLRPSNVIAYISPTVSGVHGAIAYVTNVVDAVSSAAVTLAGTVPGALNAATTDKSIDAWSGLVIWEGGPAVVGAGYERHNLSRAASALNDETIVRVVGGYSFGDAKITGLFQQEKDLLGGTSDRKVWGLGAGYKIGATTIKGQFYKANELSDCGTDGCGNNTGAKMWALGADYALSKRTTAYAAYARTNNDDAAAYSAFGGGHGDNPGTVAGKNPSGFSLGMKHSF